MVGLEKSEEVGRTTCRTWRIGWTKQTTVGRVADTSTFSWELGKDSSLYSTGLFSLRYEAMSCEPIIFLFLFFNSLR